jgi:hypothetical protein
VGEGGGGDAFVTVEDRTIQRTEQTKSPLLSDLIVLTMVTPCDVPPGVVTGDNLLKLLTHARENGYAIPAFNCTRCVIVPKSKETAKKSCV